jgi:CheY-like chemotaxis protein
VSRARILVAEDNEESLELLREYLEALEYTVAAATDGNRALDMGGTGQFDLMILDVHMPLYDGTEVLRMLRVRHRLRPIKVIALTADVLPETRQELDRAGVNGFLAKPVNLEELRLEIERVLGQG